MDWLASIEGMLASGLVFALILAFDLPEAGDPFPDRVGLDTPFIWAGAGSVLGGVVFVKSSAARRERAIRWGGLLGFLLGTSVYLLALVVQIGWS